MPSELTLDLLEDFRARGASIRESCRDASGTPAIYVVTFPDRTVIEVHDRSRKSGDQAFRMPRMPAEPKVMIYAGAVAPPSTIPELPTEAFRALAASVPKPPEVRMPEPRRVQKTEMANLLGALLRNHAANPARPFNIDRIEIDRNVVTFVAGDTVTFTLTVSIPRSGE